MILMGATTHNTRTTLTTYRCPSCPVTVDVMPAATWVGHRCPMKRGNATTTFEEVGT